MFVSINRSNSCESFESREGLAERRLFKNQRESSEEAGQNNRLERVEDIDSPD